MADAHPTDVLPQRTDAPQHRRVGLLGYGAIGSVIGHELLRQDRGCELVGVVADRAPEPLRCRSVDELIDRSDIIVEAAGQTAVRQHARTIIAAGVDLLVLSVGALADEVLQADLRCGPGRLLISSGALGGIDLLRAASLSGGLDRVTLTTRKPVDALLEPWMSDEIQARAERNEEVVVFLGSAREVVSRFPESTNVAATVALATVGFDALQVELIGHPTATQVRHVVEAEGDIGHYSFSILNHPSDNPRTSAVTPYAALRTLWDEVSWMSIR